MRKKTLNAIIAFLLVVVVGLGIAYVALSAFYFREYNPINWEFPSGKGDTEGSDDTADPDTGTTTPAATADNFLFTPKSVGSPIALIVTPYAVEGTAVSKMLTAVVSSTISDPKLDWTVEGEDGSNVLDKVSVAPTSDGALSAVVTCHAAFTETILVKATLRGVGSYSVCEVVFVGIPSEIKISTCTLPMIGSNYSINGAGEFDMSFALDNVYHQVGEKFNDFTISFYGFGRVNVDELRIDEFTLERSVKSSSVLDFSTWARNGGTGIVDPREFGFAAGPLARVVTNSSNLKLYVSHTLLEHCGKTASSVGAINITDTFNSVAEPIGFTVTVKEKVSGLSKSFTLDIGEGMMSKVTMSNDILEF